jgi:hypothetical protein
VTAKVFKLSQAARITIAVEMTLHNIPLALTLAASLLANPRLSALQKKRRRGGAGYCLIVPQNGETAKPAA